jgi:hypothetical protein
MYCCDAVVKLFSPEMINIFKNVLAYEKTHYAKSYSMSADDCNTIKDFRDTLQANLTERKFNSVHVAPVMEITKDLSLLIDRWACPSNLVKVGRRRSRPQKQSENLVLNRINSNKIIQANIKKLSKSVEKTDVIVIGSSSEDEVAPPKEKPLDSTIVPKKEPLDTSFVLNSVLKKESLNSTIIAKTEPLDNVGKQYSTSLDATVVLPSEEKNDLVDSPENEIMNKTDYKEAPMDLENTLIEERERTETCELVEAPLDTTSKDSEDEMPDPESYDEFNSVMNSQLFESFAIEPEVCLDEDISREIIGESDNDLDGLIHFLDSCSEDHVAALMKIHFHADLGERIDLDESLGNSHNVEFWNLIN